MHSWPGARRTFAKMAERVVDPFKVLGVPPTATRAEASQAFRVKAMQCHPDRNQDGPEGIEKMQALNAAWGSVKTILGRVDTPGQPAQEATRTTAAERQQQQQRSADRAAAAQRAAEMAAAADRMAAERKAAERKAADEARVKEARGLKASVKRSTLEGAKDIEAKAKAKATEARVAARAAKAVRATKVAKDARDAQAANNAAAKMAAEAAAAARLAAHEELLQGEATLIANASDDALAKVAAKRGWLASRAHFWFARKTLASALSAPPLSAQRTMNLNMIEVLEYTSDRQVCGIAALEGLLRSPVPGALFFCYESAMICYYSVKLLLTPIDTPAKGRRRRS